MSKPQASVRVVATLAPGIYELLATIAESEGRQVGNLAGYVLEEWARAQVKPPPSQCKLHSPTPGPQVISL